MISIVLVLIGLLVVGVMSNAISVLAVAGIITTLAYRYPRFFNKDLLLYIVAFMISVISVVYYLETWTFYVTKGVIGYGFFFVVMFVGVLPNKWTVSRNIKRYRGVFSILGFILITPHALLRVFGIMGGINLFGIAAYVIMVPLTIISFKIVRKQIAPKDWFTIQKAAYVIYLLLFVHLLMVSSWQDKIVYAILATLYINNKVLKEFRK